MKILFILFFFCSSTAFADLEYFLWQPSKAPFELLLPVRKGETRRAAVKRLIAGLYSKHGMKPYAMALARFSAGTFRPLKEDRTKIFTMALANNIDDLSTKPHRMKNILNPLQVRGARVAILPPGLKFTLKPKEFSELQTAINESVDVLIAVGGDDIDPALYKTWKTYAIGTNRSRDKAELSVVKSFLKAKKGFFAGICRGHQLAGVASGCTLVQDIEKELGEIHPRGIDHTIQLTKESGELTKKLFGASNRIEVMSNHHQAVNAEKNGAIKVTAFTLEHKPIIEMVEYSSGRGIGMQFHPELMQQSPIHENFYSLLMEEGERRRAERVRFQSNPCSGYARL